jgi:hypothetical protein
MISDTAVYDAFRFMGALYRDISRLIEELDDGFAEYKYESLWDNCYFNSSATPEGYDRWLPRVLTRVYVPASERESYRAFAFLNIYLTPQHRREPVACWGAGRRMGGVDLWPLWNPKFLIPGAPTFVQSGDVEPFRSGDEMQPVLDSFRYAVQPLIRLETAEAVNQLVVSPICGILKTATPLQEA